MTTANDLRKSIAALLMERNSLKERNREIAITLHMLRVKLARHPAGEITSQGNTIAPLPSDAIDDFLKDY